MYQALYRKYRPTTFDDVISQPHITTTLKNQIINGKTAHAYLFTGSRGTGKTTCARIFAKALNCESPVNGSPCGKCDICRDADNFALSDIIEIDAASNGSVNDARELREAAEYTPERCRYKVYIIDEVHMLSKDAFNALLKLIEEPPPHIKFIMATTELHKVLPTILSRCQRFDFMRIKTEDIAARLKFVAQSENITLTDDGAELIAKAADGGMRDALSILDRCIAFSENVTAEVVSEAAGIAGREQLFALAEAIADRDPAKALDIISALYDSSKDMQRLCEELAAQFRNVMIAISAPDRTGIIVCLPSELETIKRIASKLTLEQVLGFLDALSACAERMGRSLAKRIDMEMCVIRMCSGTSQSKAAPDSGEIAALNAKIAELERRLANGVPAANAAQRNAVPPKREPVKDISSAPEGSEFIYIDKWFDVIERMKTLCPALAPPLVNSYGYNMGGKLVINSKENLIRVLLKSSENKAKILEAVRDITGISLSTVLTGYRASLDRSGDKPAADEKPDADPAEKLDTLLKKAEDGGIPVDTV
ncbi:MAG: DNA polymerase III subunit gamma/tau [Huintestinicola sp.]|uniref:DNA polymerase III subunit gamma/tau n=1 Tax=Huintestinicola sp. TaxID=2981661 RepID=UPI003F0CFF05